MCRIQRGSQVATGAATKCNSSLGWLAIAIACVLTVFAPAALPGETAPEASRAPTHAEQVRQRELAQLIDQMQSSMKTMTEQMKQKDLTPQMRKEMAAQMKMMSSMMRRASHVLVGPSTDPEVHKQLEAMRREMARMPDMRKQHGSPAAAKQ